MSPFGSMGWHQVPLRSLVGSCSREFVYKLVCIRAVFCESTYDHRCHRSHCHPARAVCVVLALLPSLTCASVGRGQAYLCLLSRHWLARRLWR